MDGALGAALGGMALADQLSARARELDSLVLRVRRERDAQPHVDTSRWSGPTSWACQYSLSLLQREIEAALDLLGSAAGLTEAAAWEARANG